jgi:hypothetical protein
VAAAVEPMRAEGFKLERIFLSEGPGILVGGFGGIRKMKNGPNPNAATTFINWFASHDYDPDYSEKYGNHTAAKMQEILGR